MATAKFNSSVANSWELVIRMELGETVTSCVSLPVLDTFRDVVFDTDSSYLDVYLAGLSFRHYNFILKDYAYFQFSEVGDTVRFSYYPNPFYGLGDETCQQLIKEVEYGDLSVEDFRELLSEMPVMLDQPQIRYDSEPNHYREIEHPSAHLHIGHLPVNRWSVSRVLTPYAFTLLIMKHYYTYQWSSFSNEGNAFLNDLEECLANERSSCDLLSIDVFSEKERRLFHFS